MQYVTIVVAYSIGKPFRKPMHSNPWFCLNLVLILALNYYIVIGPHEFIRDLMTLYYGNGEPEHDLKKSGFLMVIAFASVINGALSYCFERGIVPIISRISKEITTDD